MKICAKSLSLFKSLKIGSVCEGLYLGSISAKHFTRLFCDEIDRARAISS